MHVGATGRSQMLTRRYYVMTARKRNAVALYFFSKL